jgi:hypothetical protein
MKNFIASKKISVLLFMLYLCLSQVAWATEPLCHGPNQSGICYDSDYDNKTCSIGDEINIAGVVKQIHSADILPIGFPVDHYYQHYFQDNEDTSSRYTHWSHAKQLTALTKENQDSIYAKVIQLTHFKKWEIDEPYYDSSLSDMMASVDSNFVLVMWALPIQQGDSLVINGYRANMSLMCWNNSASGTFDGTYTIYPASISNIYSASTKANAQPKPVYFYTINGKIQQQKPAFVPVVEVLE